jgi:hypothetical protein
MVEELSGKKAQAARPAKSRRYAKEWQREKAQAPGLAAGRAGGYISTLIACIARSAPGPARSTPTYFYSLNHLTCPTFIPGDRITCSGECLQEQAHLFSSNPSRRLSLLQDFCRPPLGPDGCGLVSGTVIVFASTSSPALLLHDEVAQHSAIPGGRVKSTQLRW